MELLEIPHSLIINCMGSNRYKLCSCWFVDHGKRVEIVAVDDKRQITAVFAGSLTGDFLPPQLIYKGKTKQCMSSKRIFSIWLAHHLYSHNHWANCETMAFAPWEAIIKYNGRRKSLVLPAFCALTGCNMTSSFKGKGKGRLMRMLQRHWNTLPITHFNV